MRTYLRCALPNPGDHGFPRGLVYPDTPEGLARAEQFAREQDRPGWGVFDCVNPVRPDLDFEGFLEILRKNGIEVQVP